MKDFIIKIRLLLILAWGWLTSEPKALEYAVTTHTCVIKKQHPTEKKLRQTYMYLWKNCVCWIRANEPNYNTKIGFEPSYDPGTGRAKGVFKYANVIPEGTNQYGE